MERYCRRCQTTRTVDWKEPGTTTHCAPCGEHLASAVSEKEAGRRRRQLNREQRIEAVLEWAASFMAATGCSTCGETNPACLDSVPRDLAPRAPTVIKLARQTPEVAFMQRAIADRVVLCHNCCSKQRAALTREARQAKRAAQPGFSEAMAEIRGRYFPPPQVIKLPLSPVEPPIEDPFGIDLDADAE